MMVSLEVTERRMYSHACILTYRACLSAPASPRRQIIYQSQPRYLPKQEQCLSRAEDKALSILRRRIHTMQRVLYNQPAAARNGKISGSIFFPTLLLPDVIVYTLWLRFSALLTQPACWGVYLNPDSYRKRHPQHGTRMNNLASTLCPPSEVCRVSLATSGILPLTAHATSAIACAGQEAGFSSCPRQGSITYRNSLHILFSSLLFHRWNMSMTLISSVTLMLPGSVMPTLLIVTKAESQVHF